MMWRSRLAIGQYLTDALGLKAAGDPTMQLLIIPGNPGLGSFYTVFIQELHALFQGTADVWAVSNLGEGCLSVDQWPRAVQHHSCQADPPILTIK